MYSYGPPHMAKQKQDDQLEHTYSSYVRIRDVALKTCQKRRMIGRSGERGLGISELGARYDDDDDDDYIFPNGFYYEILNDTISFKFIEKLPFYFIEQFNFYFFLNVKMFFVAFTILRPSPNL